MQTQVSYERRRVKNRKTDHERIGKDGSTFTPTQEKATCTKRTVRPYFLRRIKEKQTQTVKDFDKEDYKEIRRRIILLLKKEYQGRHFVPKTLCSETFNILEGLALDGNFMISIKEFKDRPTVFFSGEDYYSDETYNPLTLKGLDKIRSKSFRNAVWMFYRMLIENNPFTPYDNTVWYSMVSDITSNGDEISEEYKSDFKRLDKDSAKCKRILSELSEISKVDEEALRVLLEKSKTKTELESQLKDLLLSSLDYAYNSPWMPDAGPDSGGWASVSISAYDRFPITWNEADIAYLGYRMINNFYNDDYEETGIYMEKYLDENGEIKNVEDYEGFAVFIEKLNKLTSQLT